MNDVNDVQPVHDHDRLVRLEERQLELSRRVDNLERRASEYPGVTREDRDRIANELADLRKAHTTLQTDYDKMVSRSAGVFVAVLTIGAFVGWIITQVKDFFMRGHS
jgi:hypothetical protein